jgi:alkylhydroperoxidase family enzyme
MLDAVVGVVAGLLILAGVLVILGPQAMTILRRMRGLRRSRNPFAALLVPRTREPATPGLNPKTQRVLASATRLATWLRAHGQEEIARELRSAAARLATDEASGLYAMQNTLRRLRGLALGDRNAEERLKILSAELRKAVQDRFEQLELLPFGHL